MDEARAVLRRLERIEALDRERAPAELLLAELRELAREAGAWARREADARAGAAADCLYAKVKECLVSPASTR